MYMFIDIVRKNAIPSWNIPTCSFPIPLLFVIYHVSALYQLLCGDTWIMTHICERPYSKRFLIGQETLKNVVVPPPPPPISKVTVNILSFEAVWIEVRNDKHKNIVCGCLYRHPNSEIGQFLHYLSKVLAKIKYRK